MPDQFPDLFLVVGRNRYHGWKSIRVTRSLESLAGSFALEVSDRWGDQDEPWQIAEEDPCRVEIVSGVTTTTVIDGFIDKRSLSIAGTTLSLSYSGRDRAAALVDCSAIVAGGESVGKTSKKWVFRNVDVAEFARAIAAPHKVNVSVQPGLTLTKDPRLDLHPGDSCFESISRAAAKAGVLAVSDSAGGLIITRAGTARTASLVQGVNVLSASVDYDGTDRFHRYLIAAQVPGTDEASGEATRIQSEATDDAVQRTNRVILIRPDKGYNTADSRRRADWEARNRAARAETVNITVQGWMQPNGTLWPINALVRATVPRIGVDGDMLISQVEYSMGDGGQTTQLHLVRPDAFTPEPSATVQESGGAWKEIAHGADPEPIGRR